MFFLRLNKTKLLIVFFVALVLLQPLPIFARSSTEISDEITEKEDALNSKEDELDNLNDQIAYYSDQIKNSEGGIPALESEIEKISLEIERNTVELEVLVSEKELLELRRELFTLKRNEQITDAYESWRSSDPLVDFAIGSGDSSYKTQQYRGFIYEESNNEVIITTADLKDLEGELADLESVLKELESKNKTLASDLESKRAEVAALQNALAYSEFTIGTLEEEVTQISTQLNQLSLEQQQALQREKEQLNNNGSNVSISGCDGASASGSFYFCGSGRDSRQGHGVGLSQWGAHGMGLNGFTANQIIQFYFTGVQITGGYQNNTISVDGYGSMSIEAYVAGMGAYGSDLGEVPAKACGNAAQVSSNPEKYVIDNPSTSFDCWPEEAIKAQAIAYRTYGLNYAARAGSVCTTTVCQYYNGKTHAQWAADETAGQVVTSGGTVIEALYSSDNSQGFGTANNETVWQGYDGTGYPVSYLRAVNDSAYATTTSWTYWSYSTNTYTGSDIDTMLNYAVNSPYIAGGLKSYLSSVKSSVGSVSSISFERDGSSRVAKVVLTGSGGTAVIGGTWFKAAWNTWVDDTGVYNQVRAANGEGQIPDFIYSLTYFTK